MTGPGWVGRRPSPAHRRRRATGADLNAEAAMGRKSARHAGAAVVLVALAWGTYRATAGWWYRAELSRANGEMAAGRFGPARERLARLSRIWPGEAAVDYQLGLCEEAAGCPDRALAAWARIAPGSPFTAKAARARDELLRQLHDRG